MVHLLYNYLYQYPVVQDKRDINIKKPIKRPY